MSSIELLPVSGDDSFDTVRLQGDLPAMVTVPEVRHLLELRHHWTAVRTMSTPERTADMLTGACRMDAEGTLRAYRVWSKETRENIGFATLIPTLPLRRLRLPVPPFPVLWLVPGIVADNKVAVEGSNVTAWIDNRRESYASELTQAYAVLGQLASQHYKAERLATPAVWTIEPNRAAAAPHLMHRILQEAGLTVQGQGYFDDTERNTHPVLRSTLFTSQPS